MSKAPISVHLHPHASSSTRTIIENFLNYYGITNEFLKEYGYEKENFFQWQYSNKKDWNRLEKIIASHDSLAKLALLKELKYIREMDRSSPSKKVVLPKKSFLKASSPLPPSATSFSFVSPQEKEVKKPTAESINEEFCHTFNKNLTKIAEQLRGEMDKPIQSGYKKKNFVQKRVLNLLLSDLHFHSLLDNREVPYKYGAIEEARRLAAVIQAVIHFKTHYRDTTSLYIHIIGDVIQNSLHDPRDGAPLAEQVAAAQYLLVQAIHLLSLHFLDIKVLCVSGNHGRNTARHPNRAVTQRWDSIEQILYYAIKGSCKELANVSFEIDYRSHYECEVLGHHMFFTHGDSVIQPGNPGKSINVTNIRRQVNEINAKSKHAKHFNLFAVGHVHTASQTHLPNQTVFLTNGALVPTDSYGVSLGIFESTCAQWLWETVPKYVFGDSRLIMVGEDDDANGELDLLIKPFSSF